MVYLNHVMTHSTLMSGVNKLDQNLLLGFLLTECLFLVSKNLEKAFSKQYLLELVEFSNCLAKPCG